MPNSLKSLLPAEGALSLAGIVWAMRNWASVADTCAVTEGHAPACIRTWADMLEALSRAPIAEGGAVDTLRQIRRVIGNGDTAHLAMDASATVGLGQFIDAAIESLSRQGGEAYPTGSDREVLLYLMQQFDGEVWNCERCGHAEDTATMDSAHYLRQYLAANPTRASEAGDWVLVPRECTTKMELVLSDALATGDYSIAECLDKAIAAAPAPGGE